MKVLRIGVCLLIAFTVFAHGAVDAWAAGIMEIAAAALFLLWAVLVALGKISRVRWTSLHTFLLALFCCGLAQWAFHATVYPYLTRVELLKVAAYLMAFFVFTQAFYERWHLAGFAWFLILLGFATALLGIAQEFTADGKVYWVLEPPFGVRAFGPYVNRNHFAGLMELIIPQGLALMMFRGIRREQVLLMGLFTAVMAGALIMSGSRAGIVTFGFELALLLVLLFQKGTARQRGRFLSVVALAFLSLVVWLGASKALDTVSRMRPGEISVSRRFSLFRGASQVFLHHPVAGTGLGTLVAVYPKYETAYDGKVIDHAHNDYMEGLAEMGLIGAVFAFAFLWVLFRDAFERLGEPQGHFSLAMHAGALAGASGLLVHSFVDFNLHIPSNALLFLILAYLAVAKGLVSEAPGMDAARISQKGTAVPGPP